MIDGSRYGVIDIGSNSVRLVVYGAPLRAPSVLFNEKVMAGLGKTSGVAGYLDPEAMARTLVALARFYRLAGLLAVAQPHTVATAAVRDAANGQAFLDEIGKIGLKVSLLSGEEEAEAAGYGVIAGFQNADGVVGDLGGGSLELARVKNGKILQRISFPLGVLRIPDIRARGPDALNRHFGQLLKANGWLGAAAGLPFYLVGGSWRSLAKLHMSLAQHPLPILHNYTMPPQAAGRIARRIERAGKDMSLFDGVVAPSRRAALADAAAMLVSVVDHLKPTALTVSTNGVREGLVYRQLAPEIQRLDPLIVAARAEADRQGRFAEHGDLIYHWFAPLFAGESDQDARLRRTACLLGDIGWAANPDFRAERALEFALHGNWQAIDEPGRAMIGQALFSAFGGGARPPLLERLAPVAALDQAQRWGLAIRLAQRLSGGTAEPLQMSEISIAHGQIDLRIAPEIETLCGELVSRRLRQLAAAMGLDSKITIAAGEPA